MKATVCELRNDPAGLEADWQKLAGHVQAEGSEFVLLPEMPFHPWLAASEAVSVSAWEESVKAHEAWIAGRLPDLIPAVVGGTRPVIVDDRRLNEAFLWDKQGGLHGIHFKYYLPNEEGFWEATWYEQGKKDFSVTEAAHIKLGYLICTELWFNEHARDYGKAGAHIILCPRATPPSTVDKWIAGGRVVSVVSGAYSLSSNFGGVGAGKTEWGGGGWIIEPEEGVVLGITTKEQPFLTLDLDVSAAGNAKKTYPRYVKL